MHWPPLRRELLHATGAAFVAQARAPWTAPNFRRKRTAENQLVRVYPPSQISDRLYSVEFAMMQTEDGKRMVLCPALVVKKGAQDSLVGRLVENGVCHVVSGYAIYGQAVTISEGQELGTMAGESGQHAVELLRGCDLLPGGADPAADAT